MGLAQQGKTMFEEIRALFPIPSLTMHFVMRDDLMAERFADLEGKTVLLGKGSFDARESAKYVYLFSLKDKVELPEVELSNAGPSLKNGQIDAFVTAGFLSRAQRDRGRGRHLCRAGGGHRHRLDGRRHGLRTDQDLLARESQDGGERRLLGGTG